MRLVLCPTLMFRQSASYNFMTPSWDMCVYIHHTDLISFAFTIGKTFLISLSCHLVLIISAISYTVTRRKSIGKGFLTSMSGFVTAGIDIYRNQYSKPLHSGALLWMPREGRKRGGKLTVLLGAFQLYHSVGEELSKKLSKLTSKQEDERETLRMLCSTPGMFPAAA